MKKRKNGEYHTIAIDGDKIQLNPLTVDPTTPAEGWLWHLAGTIHKLRFHDGTEVKSVGDITGTEVDGKISDHAGIPAAHHAKYTDAEAQATVKTNVEVGDLKAPTKALAMNAQGITGIADGVAGTDAMALGQKYTDAEAQSTVKTNVEVGDLKAPTKALAMNAQKVTGLAAATLEGDAIPADANVRAPDSSKLEGSTKTEVQTHAPAAHDHSGDTLSPAVVNVGDIGFRNGWRLTEDDEHGLVLVSPEGGRFALELTPI